MVEAVNKEHTSNILDQQMQLPLMTLKLFPGIQGFFISSFPGRADIPMYVLIEQVKYVLAQRSEQENFHLVSF